MEKVSEIFSVFSRMLNVLRGGTADMTFCAVVGRDNPWYQVWIDWVVFLVLNEEGHCEKSWESHVERARKTLKKSAETQAES